MYIELVQTKVSNRPGKCIPLKELNKYRLNTRGNPLYRSTFLFTNEFQGSISNYMKDMTIDNIVLDIDYQDDGFMDLVRSIIFELKEYISEYQYIPCFSGTGFHLIFSAGHFDFEPQPNLHRTVKATIDRMFDGADLSVFNKTSIYRVANTRNQKNGLYKIPVTEREVFNKDYKEIRDMARKPRFDFEFEMYDFETKEDLTEFKETPTLISVQKVHEPKRIASCISNILNSKPRKGERHPTALRITSHFRRSGIPSDITKNVIMNWLKDEPDKTEEEISRIVEQTYNKGYKYGCKDTILAQYCSPHCIYYNKKNYKQAVHTITDMHRLAKQKITTDFSGSTLNLDKIFDLPEDSRAYPGEVIVLVGQTGAGKTALAQQIVSGVNIYGNQINSLLPTLYLSLEMSNFLMYRRWWQQLQDVNKKQAKKAIKTSNGELKELSHVMLRYISPDLNTIMKEIREHQPKLLVIDHIKLLRGGNYSEREKISEITRTLRNAAAEFDMIILEISHISRKYSRNMILDLYSAMESSTIENDCSKFIGLWGNQNSPYKMLEYFKNRDGEPPLPTQYLKLINSMRFQLDPEQNFEDLKKQDKIKQALK